MITELHQVCIQMIEVYGIYTDEVFPHATFPKDKIPEVNKAIARANKLMREALETAQSLMQ